MTERLAGHEDGRLSKSPMDRHFTDDAPDSVVLEYALMCASHHAYESRVLGNLRAGDLVRALRATRPDERAGTEPSSPAEPTNVEIGTRQNDDGCYEVEMDVGFIDNDTFVPTMRSIIDWVNPEPAEKAATALRALLARPAERPEGHWAPGLRESIQAFLDSWMEPEKPPIAISAFAAEVDRLYRAVYEGGAS